MRFIVPTALLFATLVLATAVRAESDPGELTAAFRKHMGTLQIENGLLRGPAASGLLDSARSAQFVLIGEDHGFADVPLFAMALVRSLGDAAPEHLVLEIGPYSATRVHAALTQGRKQLTALNRAYPSALPFLNLREDGDLAALFVDAGAHRHRLWGIDQEFILSAAMHIDTLIQDSTDAESRSTMTEYRKRAQTAYDRMVAEHDPGSMPLLQFTADDFGSMQTLFAGKEQSRSRALITALATSTDIYRTQSSAPYQSNLTRSQLMKRTFMDYYRRAGADLGTRALFKMGAFHAGRGRSAVGLYDIGNLASELAESNGSHSLHVLVIAGGGTVNRWRPFIADRASLAQAYDATEELSVLGAAPVLAAADEQAWSLFDLGALRRTRLPADTPARTRDLIYNYDQVLVIPAAQAAVLDE